MVGSKSLCYLTYSIPDYVKKWGNAASIALLDPSCHIFSSSAFEGIIGYREVSNSMIVFGDPVCMAENTLKLAIAFHEYCKNIRKNIVYIAASERFMHLITDHKKYSAIEVGKEVILDPSIDILLKKGKYPSLLRNKFNQLERSDITIHEYDQNDEELEKQLLNSSKEWSKNRKGPQIYLLEIDLFKDRENKRWFYAQQNNKIVGILMMNRVDAYEGWVLNMLMLLPTAPSYLSECMVIHAFNVLKKEECNFLSIGLLPSLELGVIKGLNTVYTWAAKMLFKVAKKVFNLQDRQRYWKKFSPNKKPSFVMFSSPYLRPTTIISLMRALHAGI